MPTIELTDAQAEELRKLVQSEVDSLQASIAEHGGEHPIFPAMINYESLSVYMDILHLLEIS
jgi:hypothetical protein